MHSKAALRARILAALLLAGCTAKLETDESASPIINGALESGYPAVGALVSHLPDADPTGSFCSATLISPTWVLTAAHCVVNAEARLPPALRGGGQFVHFYVGADARNPTVDEIHAAKAIYVHPGYAFENAQRLYDIALVELEAPVPNVTPIPIHRGPLPTGFGIELFYVGFGQSNPDGGGGGQKRSATLTLESLAPVNYVTVQLEGGVCFGDSGGPGLIDVGGTYEVAGVNSSVVGGTQSCLGRSVQVRVDTYQSWIDMVMGNGTPCTNDPSVCSCDRACGADGICDNALCGEQGCATLESCVNRCFSSECAVLCLNRADPEANHLFIALNQCIAEECPDREVGCVDTRCRRQQVGCAEGLDAVTGEQTCAQMYRCSEPCEDLDCVDTCFYEGTLETQDDFHDIETCVEASCVEFEGDALVECRARFCRDELLDCLPNDACRLTGGTCESGEACMPEPWAATYCRASEDIAVGETCTDGTAACVDGAICAAGRCREMCTSANDCESSYAPCTPVPMMALAVSVGVCSLDCPDADGDGACDAEDCNPFDASVSPLARELCDEHWYDEDCDGERNEICEVPEPPAPMLPEDEGGCTCVERGADGAWLLALLPLLFVRRRWWLALFLTSACTFGEEPEPLPPPPMPIRDAGVISQDGAVPLPPTIYDVQQGLVAPGTEVVIDDAIVTTPEDVSGFFVSDGTQRAHSGLWVSTATSGAEPTVQRGDVVSLRGIVEEVATTTVGLTLTRTQLSIVGPSAITITGTAEVPSPVVLSPVDLGLPELAALYEGVVVRVEDVAITNRSAETGLLELDDIVLAGDLFADFDYSWLDVGARFDAVSGALHHDERGFVLLPRGSEDIERPLPDPLDCSPTGGYTFCNFRVNYTTARRYCAAQGGRLVVLETMQENVALGARVANFTNSRYWVGANDQITEGEWLWIDGSTLAYDPWGDGEPNDAGNGEDCAESNWQRVDGQWNDANCFGRKRFVCEFRTPMACIGNDQCPDGSNICDDGDCQP